MAAPDNDDVHVLCRNVIRLPQLLAQRTSRRRTALAERRIDNARIDAAAACEQHRPRARVRVRRRLGVAHDRPAAAAGAGCDSAAAAAAALVSRIVRAHCRCVQ